MTKEVERAVDREVGWIVDFISEVDTQENSVMLKDCPRGMYGAVVGSCSKTQLLYKLCGPL